MSDVSIALPVERGVRLPRAAIRLAAVRAWAHLDRASLWACLAVGVMLLASWFWRPSLSDASWWIAIPVAVVFYFRTFAFFIGLVVVGSAILPLSFRKRLRAAATAVLGVVLMVPEARHAFPASAAQPAPWDEKIHIYSVNLLRGNMQMDRVYRSISAENPEFILFQEYTWQHDAAIMSVLGANYPNRIIYPSYDFQGLAIYSKRPITQELAPLLGTPHPRALAVRFESANGKAMRLVNLHPTSPGPPSRIMANRQQIGWLIDYMTTSPLPTIVAGDCNFPFASQQSDALRAAGLAHADDQAGSGVRWSWGPFRSKWAVTRIDHVFFTRDFTAASSRVLGSVGSDHAPVSVELVAAR